MIEAKLFRAEGVVEVLPSGALKAVDFEQLAALVDPFIEANGELKGLMIVADRFPGWDSLGALIGHVRFVREHDLTFRGDFPLNTHGGQLSFGQAGAAGGFSQVIEAADQIAGRAGERQLVRCDLAYVSGTGGVMSEQGALLLRGG